MIKKLLIVGSNGNMGRRYLAICDYLKIPSAGIDIFEEFNADDFNGVIIATPTNTHCDLITCFCNAFKRPVRILCEKPLTTSKDAPQILSFLKPIQNFGHKIFMVNQYAFYPALPKGAELSSYDFYHSGKDGLSWDCIQIIYLARGKIELSNKSPIWKCQVNGLPLSRDKIDSCYVNMIEAFWNEKDTLLWGLDDIFAAHSKVKKYDECPNWNPSTQ